MILKTILVLNRTLAHFSLNSRLTGKEKEVLTLIALTRDTARFFYLQFSFRDGEGEKKEEKGDEIKRTQRNTDLNLVCEACFPR